MSVLLYFVKAWVIGFALAAYPGPIGMLCIRKTLQLGMLGAIGVGLGAALADMVYALIGVLGLSAVSHFLLDHAAIIRLLGGTFLLFLAYRELRNKTNPSSAKISSSKHFIKFTVEVFFIVLTSPMTILSFIAIFASIGGINFSSSAAAAMVIGLFLGSMAWFLILGVTLTKLKHKLPDSWITGLRYISAIIFAGFGVFAIVSAYFMF